MEAISFNSVTRAMSNTNGLVSEIKVDEAKFNQLRCQIVGDEELKKNFIKIRRWFKQRGEAKLFQRPGISLRYKTLM